MRPQRSSPRRLLAIGLVTVLGAAAVAYASSSPPTSGEIAFAQRTSDLLLNELFAALLTEFDETTPANVNEGRQAISIIFHNQNRDIRLVGTLAPLQGGNNDRPSDSFETPALQQALVGQPVTDVQRVNDRWYLRRSIPLSNFHQNCVLCHSNFGPQNPTQWVGALMIRVAIDTGDVDDDDEQ